MNHAASEVAARTAAEAEAEKLAVALRQTEKMLQEQSELTAKAEVNSGAKDSADLLKASRRAKAAETESRELARLYTELVESAHKTEEQSNGSLARAEAQLQLLGSEREEQRVLLANAQASQSAVEQELVAAMEEMRRQTALATEADASFYAEKIVEAEKRAVHAEGQVQRMAAAAVELSSEREKALQSDLTEERDTAAERLAVLQKQSDVAEARATRAESQAREAARTALAAATAARSAYAERAQSAPAAKGSAKSLSRMPAAHRPTSAETTVVRSGQPRTARLDGTSESRTRDAEPALTPPSVEHDTPSGLVPKKIAADVGASPSNESSDKLRIQATTLLTAERNMNETLSTFMEMVVSQLRWKVETASVGKQRKRRLSLNRQRDRLITVGDIEKMFGHLPDIIDLSANLVASLSELSNVPEGKGEFISSIFMNTGSSFQVALLAACVTCATPHRLCTPLPLTATSLNAYEASRALPLRRQPMRRMVPSTRRPLDI
jgi:hypothetical protein